MKVSAKPIERVPHGLPALRSPARRPVQAGLVALGAGASCFFADRRGGDRRRNGRLVVDTGEVSLPKPIVMTALPLVDGGTRHVVLVGQDAAVLARRRIDLALDGVWFATLDPDWLQSPLRTVPELVSGLLPDGAARLARLVLTAGARLFAAPGGAAALDGLLGPLGACRLGPSRWCRTGMRSCLLSVPLPAALASEPEYLVLVAGGVVRHLPTKRMLVERTEGGGWLHVALPLRPDRQAVLAGLASRPFVIEPPRGAPLPLAPALATHVAGVKEWIGAGLATDARRDEIAASLLGDLRSENKGRRIVQIARTRTGIFLWLDDDAARPATLRIVVEGRAAEVCIASEAPQVAFAALPLPVPPDAEVLVAAFGRSGTSEVLHRGAVPALTLGPEHLRVAGPALARAVLDSGQATEVRAVEAIGAANAARSIAVVTNFGSEETLRALVASLAAEGGTSRGELVVVARAGEEAERVRRVLFGGYAVFGQPARLVAVGSDAGEAAALAAVLSVTASDRALLLGRDVLPLGPAWLRTWIRAIRPSSPAPIGGTLLAPDGSVLHAGGFGWIERPERAGTVRERPVADAAPKLRSIPSTHLTAACAGLGRVGIDALLRASPSCPDLDTLLSLLVRRHGGRVRADFRFARYGDEGERAAVLGSLRPHMLAALLECDAA